MREGGWTRPLAGFVLVMAAAGALARRQWPAPEPALPCAPADVRWLDAGGRMPAACGTEGPPSAAAPAGQALVVGQRLHLNRATAEELTALPGVGPQLAQELVRARDTRGGFQTWEEVDAVPGVGPARLEVLVKTCDLESSAR